MGLGGGIEHNAIIIVDPRSGCKECTFGCDMDCSLDLQMVLATCIRQLRAAALQL